MLTYTQDYGAFQTTIDIMPAPAWRRPWPGYWSRWWFELSYRTNSNDEISFWTKGPEGGGLSLRRCMWNAFDAENKLFACLKEEQ
jgi:hypothetical protein